MRDTESASMGSIEKIFSPVSIFLKSGNHTQKSHTFWPKENTPSLIKLMCVIVDWTLVKAEYEEEIHVPIKM